MTAPDRTIDVVARQQGLPATLRDLVSTPRRVFWASFLAFLALGLTWAVASPLISGPDESTHMAKAAGVVRGQMVGTEVRPGYFQVQVPYLYKAADSLPGCFNFTPDIPASCVKAIQGDTSAIVAENQTAGTYNPLYYAIVGVASLLPSHLETLYAMRAVSALLIAMVLALGMRSIAELPRPGWAAAGVFLGVTPMVAFFSGIVNPNSLEAAAGLSLWATLGATLFHHRPEILKRRMLRAGVLVVLLSNAKPISLLFLAVIVLTCAVAVPWRSVTRVVADRRSWPGLALGALGALAALAWLALVRGQSTPGPLPYPELTPPVAANIVLRETSVYLTNMLGQFGWVDTNLPIWLYMVLGALILVPVFIALAVASVRQRIAVVVVVLFTVGLPIALQVPEAERVGIPWQGRYLLAVATGIPVLAGLALASRKMDEGQTSDHRKLALTVIRWWSLAQIAAYCVALRRYVVGAGQPLFQTSTNPWHPPLPWPVLVVGNVVAVGLVALLTGQVIRRRDGGGAHQPAGSFESVTDSEANNVLHPAVDHAGA